MKRLLGTLADRDHVLAGLTVAGLVVALLLGYGERQQRDEILIAQDGRPTAYAAKD